MASTAYTVNGKGEVWTLGQQGGGDLLSTPNQDFAADIGVGADGSVWVITTEARPGGAVPAWLADASTRTWTSLARPAAAARVAVAADGTAWTVNDKGEVWTLHKQGGGSLYSPPGQDFAADIGVGADGSVWVITTEPQQGQAGAKVAWLSDASSKTWTTLAPPAAAVRIAVAADGTAWTVNDKGEVWTLHKQGGGSLYSPPNEEFAFDIGVGPAGVVWVITSEDRPGGAAPAWLADASSKSWTTLAPPAAAVSIAATLSSFGAPAIGGLIRRRRNRRRRWRRRSPAPPRRPR